MVRIKSLIVFIFCSVVVLGQTPMRSGLVGYWKLEETSGTTASDETSNSNDLTITDATNATGKIGYSRDFDGSGDIINSTSNLSDMPSDIGTFAFWINVDNYTTTSNKNFIVLADAITWSNGVVSMYHNTSLSWYIYIGSTGTANNAWQKINVSSYIAEGSWTHVAFKWDTNTDEYNMFVNGSEVTPSGTNIVSNPSGIDNISIANYSGSPSSSGLDCRMDEVMVWSRLLLDIEIEQLYNSGDGLLYVYENYLNDGDFEKFNNYAKEYFAQKFN